MNKLEKFGLIFFIVGCFAMGDNIGIRGLLLAFVGVILFLVGDEF